MGDRESQTPATIPGLQALTHNHGSRWLEQFPLPEIKGSQNPKQAPDTGVSPQKLPREVGVIGDTNWEVPRSPRGLHAQGCILPRLIRVDASPCTRQKRVTVSHTASRPGDLS